MKKRADSRYSPDRPGRLVRPMNDHQWYETKISRMCQRCSAFQVKNQGKWVPSVNPVCRELQQRASPELRAMMGYMLYLFDHDRRLIAGEPLDAADDRAAGAAGAVVLEVCNDVVDEYEVWRDHELIACGRHKRGLFDLQTIIDNRQANIIDVEDRLQRGFTAVARSRRLLRVTEQIRRCGLL